MTDSHTQATVGTCTCIYKNDTQLAMLKKNQNNHG